MTQEELEQLDKLLFKAENILIYGGVQHSYTKHLSCSRGVIINFAAELVSAHSTPESLTILE